MPVCKIGHNTICEKNNQLCNTKIDNCCKKKTNYPCHKNNCKLVTINKNNK